MEHGITLIAIVHIIAAFILVVIVLLQDSKGGGLGASFGGGSNQSIFGASGASSFLVKVTRWVAVGFMLTSVTLTILSAHKNSHSVLDGIIPTSTAPAAPVSPVTPAK